MGAKKLKLEQTEREMSDDPDYYPSHHEAKKRKTEKKNSIQLKATDGASTSGSGRTRTNLEDLYDSTLSQFSVVVKTERALASLQRDFPYFVKCMLPTTVEIGFWMYIPKDFCNLHLPNHDCRIVLVDDSGEEYITKFILARSGLSAGWRNFSLVHKLKKGEMLIFQLIEPCKLKVHIVRIPDPDVIIAAKIIMQMSDSWIEPDAEDLKNKIEMLGKRWDAILIDVSTQLEDRRKCTEPSCLICSR